MLGPRRWIVSVLAIAALPLILHAQSLPPRDIALAVRPVKWPEVRAIVARLANRLPTALKYTPPEERDPRWPSWVSSHRGNIAGRVTAGDRDSLVNLLLFGSSFTTQPRITSAFAADLDRRRKSGDAGAQAALETAYRQRATDLVAAAGTGRDERLQFARYVLEQRGNTLRTDTGRKAATQDLVDLVARMREEAATIERTMEEAGARNGSGGDDADAVIFRTSGLSPDSSVVTQYAVDRAICAIAAERRTGERPIARVAIIGPGLDFVDKQEGFDFYPPQSLQPFLTIDSLLGCGVSALSALKVTTLDINRRVNAHLRSVTQRAQESRTPYRLVLPRDTSGGWTAEALDYWKRAGQRIGSPVDVAAPASLAHVAARGISINPDLLARLRIVEANIVLDRIDLPEDQHFDLVIATNVFRYYEVFEQALAEATAAAMLRPGGLLITNDSIAAIPEIPLALEREVAVSLSDRAGDTEQMAVYRRK